MTKGANQKYIMKKKGWFEGHVERLDFGQQKWFKDFINLVSIPPVHNIYLWPALY